MSAGALLLACIATRSLCLATGDGYEAPEISEATPWLAYGAVALAAAMTAILALKRSKRAEN
jgi:hypothetical protein